MAKLELKIKGDFTKILNKIEKTITYSSASSSLEDKSDFVSGEAKCSVRVFERYSYIGHNRLSMNVTLFQNGKDEDIIMSAITAGGSSAIFFKINTFGEEAFLDELRAIFNIKNL